MLEVNAQAQTYAEVRSDTSLLAPTVFLSLSLLTAQLVLRSLQRASVKTDRRKVK